MTALPLRRVAFAFDEHTPFQWNRRNPHFGLLGNTVSFFAQPFERYMVAAMRDARPRIRMNLRLLLSQWPFHDPDRERVPPIASHWIEAYAAGRDVTRWYAPPAA